MGTVTRCAYCNWVATEPSPNEFDTWEAYEQELADFHDSHDNLKRNTCPAVPVEE
jgi:hypothetical protein